MKLKLTWPTEHWAILLKDTLIVGSGVALTYFVHHITGTEFGVWTPLVVGILSFVINFLHKSVSLGS